MLGISGIWQVWQGDIGVFGRFAVSRQNFRYIFGIFFVRFSGCTAYEKTPEPWYSNIPGFSIPVRAGGVEPPRAYTHCHLKTARLPFRHARKQSINLHLYYLWCKSACRNWWIVAIDGVEQGRSDSGPEDSWRIPLCGPYPRFPQCERGPDQAACSALYCVPQSFIASMIGCSVRPVSVSEYSTRGGTSGYTSRCTNPSRSI